MYAVRPIQGYEATTPSQPPVDPVGKHFCKAHVYRTRPRSRFQIAFRPVSKLRLCFQFLFDDTLHAPGTDRYIYFVHVRVCVCVCACVCMCAQYWTKRKNPKRILIHYFSAICVKTRRSFATDLWKTYKKKVCWSLKVKKNQITNHLKLVLVH